MSKTEMIVALVAASAAAVGVYRWHGAGTASEGGSTTVVDRIWLDHVPTGETDRFNAFLAVSEEVAGEQLGIYQNASMWVSQHELFRYDAKRGKLVVTFPQTGETEELTARAAKCNKNGMDFCLQIDGGSRGVKQYYSRKGWEIEGHGQSAAQLEQRIEQVEASVK